MSTVDSFHFSQNSTQHSGALLFGKKDFQKSVNEQREKEMHFESTFSKLEYFKMGSFLENHSINERQRAKMLDWMIEVLKIY